MNPPRLLRRIFGGNPASAPASAPVAASSVVEDVTRLLPKLSTPAEDRIFNFFMPTFWGTSKPEPHGDVNWQNKRRAEAEKSRDVCPVR